MPPRKDFTGKVYGKLTVVGPSETGRVWNLRCECGESVADVPSKLAHRVASGLCPRCPNCTKTKTVYPGLQIGLLTAVRSLGGGHPVTSKWEWRCSCDGRIVIRVPNYLKNMESSGFMVSCGCARRFTARREDHTGIKYGMLTAVCEVGASNNQAVIWQFRCDCGETVDRVAAGIKRRAGKGKIPNCGCRDDTVLTASMGEPCHVF